MTKVAYGFLMALKKHPILIGFNSSVLSIYISTIDKLTPIFQFVALVLGIVIAILTIRIKWIEWRMNEIKYKKHNQQKNEQA